ncbi:MAG TPA: hypothetical protein VKT49_22790 [Bryobacteraceae bacterium]|nr:hypothetical protein [Bryobacteraceae bacterium]
MTGKKTFLVAGIGCAALLITAQTTANGPMPNFTATTDNLTTNDTIRINLLRWSTDAERDQLLGAWNLTARAERGGGGRGARAEDGSGVGDPAPAGAPAGGRGSGRGGRGGAPPAPRTPEGSLAAALDKVPTVGYLWSSEVAGYALRYAVRLPQANGGERIVLITDRRLGAFNDSWKPADTVEATIPKYEFSLIELRLNAKGEGEGKASLTGKVTADTAAKTLALENYDAAPVVFKNVRLSK